MEDLYMNLEAAEFFNLLESNQQTVVEDIKCLIHEHLNTIKEAWLVQGLYDYCISKSSQRAMEILLGLREPHDKHLFDKLSESLRGNQRLSALVFMGFLVRRQPQWLYKISSHNLMKDLIKILKSDNDVVILVNALLVLTALIPIIPIIVSSLLNEIFEAFSRLAAFNYSNQPKEPEVYILHLQIALYALFHRLYGMYPCNFLSYLRQHYGQRENLPIFSHTVKPMVETVRMHPLLVTASKDIEIGQARWKQMSVHDIVTECAKYSLLENQETAHREDLTCSLVHSSSCTTDRSTPQAVWLNEAMNPTGEWTSPAQWISTPLPKTPVTRVSTPKLESAEVTAAKIASSSASRTLSLTPSLPPPTSPLKKDFHSFKYPADRSDPNHDRRGPVIEGKLKKIAQEQQPPLNIISEIISGMRSRHSSGAHVETRKNVTSPVSLSEQCAAAAAASKTLEKEISAEDREVCRLLSPKSREGDKDTHGTNQFWFQSREGTPFTASTSRPDSLLQEKVEGDEDDDDDDEEPEHREEEMHKDEHEATEEVDILGPDSRSGARGMSPCDSGGLHMPDKRHFSDFVLRFKRLRYYSQCLPNVTNVYGSPGSGSSFGTILDVPATVSSNILRKRSSSCPDLRKPDVTPCEMVRERGQKEEASSRHEQVTAEKIIPVMRQSIMTQTEDLWPPTPYDHLFLNVLPPSLFLSGQQPAIETSPRLIPPSELLDRYIESSFHNHERQCALIGKASATEDVAFLKGQVMLLHSQLQFERHRREVHAERNRRLLAKAKGVRFLEEENHSLKSQLLQYQNEVAALRKDTEYLRRSRNNLELEKSNISSTYEQKVKQYAQEAADLMASKCQLEEELNAVKTEFRQLRRQTDALNATLFDAEAEMAVLQTQADESRRYQQELKEAQYHLIAAREAASLLQQQLILPLATQNSFEIEEITRSCKEEVKTYRENLERERRLNEALTAKLAHSDSSANKREAELAEQKRLLQSFKEEQLQMLQVVEQKYESIKSINAALESNILQLRQQLEASRSRHARRRQLNDTFPAEIYPPPPAPGFSASPSSPPSFSSNSGTSPEQLSVSLAVEASEGLNEFYWQGIETAALNEVTDLPIESTGQPSEEHLPTATHSHGHKPTTD